MRNAEGVGSPRTAPASVRGMDRKEESGMTQIVLRLCWGVSKYQHVHMGDGCISCGRRAQLGTRLLYTLNTLTRKEEGKQILILPFLIDLNSYSYFYNKTTKQQNVTVWPSLARQQKGVYHDYQHKHHQ